MITRKINQKKIAIFSFILLACFFNLFLISHAVLGADSDFTLNFDPGNTLSNVTKLGNNDPATITYGIINTALIFLGLITVVMIIIAGFLWLFAAGNEEKIKKAQGILKGALIGLLIIMASYGAAQYIFDKIIEITAEAPASTVTTPDTDTPEGS